MTVSSPGRAVGTAPSPAAASSAPALGAVTPSRAEFRELAALHRVIPVTRRLLADDETPVGVYRKLAGDRPGTFLFESAENGRSWSRWSFVGARSAAALTAVDGELVWTGEVPERLPASGDPLAALRTVIEELASEPLPGLPPLTGGMVGYLGYDIVRRLERLPEYAEDDLRIPELVMLLATDLAAVDHHEGTITLIANAINWDASDERVDEAYDDAVARLDRMTADLAAPAPSTVGVYQPAEPAFTRRRTPAEHHAAVEAAKEQIRAGEAFQVVVAQRFEMPCPAAPLDVYRVLRATNPSPYMYLLRLESAQGQRFDIVGSSPEALVTVLDGVVTTHPIAGTRWRGATEEEDIALEKDLRTDEKERAEHVMLVDLGRNDLGRVCEPGTVEGAQLLLGRALQPRDAPGVDGDGAAARATATPSTPSPRASRRARSPARRSRARWRSSRSWSPPGAGCTAGSSATSTSRATPTPRSRSARRWCATASPTCRRAAGSWPTPTPSRRTPSA